MHLARILGGKRGASAIAQAIAYVEGGLGVVQNIGAAVYGADPPSNEADALSFDADPALHDVDSASYDADSASHDADPASYKADPASYDVDHVSHFAFYNTKNCLLQCTLPFL